MVGVPGKSRGCHTCRRRKVRCDESRPTCQRCARSDRECEGYDKTPVFLNRTARGLEKRRHLDEVRIPGDSATVSLTTSVSGGDLQRLSISSGQSSRQERSTDLGTSSSGTPHLGKVELPMPELPRRPSDMELTAGEIRRTLIEQYFPAALDPRGAPFAQWLQLTLDLNPWGELLESALLAFTMTRLGIVENNTAMNMQGRLKYGKALKILQETLLDDQQSMQDQTLAACNVLKFYEICESTENTVQSPYSHVHGIVRLIIHRGSDRNDSEFAQSIINDIRYGAMLAAMKNRKRDPMGPTTWSKDHWDNLIDVEQSLYDRGFEIGAITEDLDLQLASPTHSAKSLSTFLRRALDTAKELKSWYASASMFLGWSHQWSSPLPASSESDIPSEALGKGKDKDTDTLRSSPVVDFERLCESLQTTEFWALLISVSLLIQSLASQLPEGLPESIQLLSEAKEYGSALQLHLASNIIDQVPYQIQLNHGLRASGRAIFGLDVASQAARNYSTDEAQQILDRIDVATGWIAEGRGLRYARVVMEAG